jgi:hypothetical protein
MMNPPSLLVRLIGWALTVLLLIELLALVYGHMDGAEQGLTLSRNYISEYEARAPHWPWIIVSIFAFAVMLILLAFGFFLRLERTVPGALGCALLAAASTGMFFVAYAPMRRVEQPPGAAYAWWTPHWWFTSQTSRTPYEHGMADAYSDVHYHAIKLVLVNGLTGMALLGTGLLTSSTWKGFAWSTIGAAVAMSVLFLMGELIEDRHGLWQRLGFAVMYFWLCACRWRLTSN